jgi:nucleotide-binding universal stress UspA family protein
MEDLKLPFAAHYGLWAKESQDELLRKVLESLNMASREILQKFPSIVLDTRIEKGRPARVITEIAKKENFDLIIIGNRGYGLLEGWMLGSVSNEIINSSEIPVLIIK